MCALCNGQRVTGTTQIKLCVVALLLNILKLCNVLLLLLVSLCEATV